MDLSFLTKAGIPVIQNALLAKYTTFQLGGPCAALIECNDAQQISFAVSTLRANDQPFVLMGFGSNILASDQGIDRVILRYSSATPAITRHGNNIRVDAATQIDALAEYAVNAGLAGLTTFSGIPGTVGGAIAGNAGAYGAQISDSLITLTVLDKNNSVSIIPRHAVKFAYRDSDIKHNGTIILSAEFTLLPGDKAGMSKQRADIIRERESKHGRWQETPCAGSFFRNVEPTSQADRRQSAGGIIEQAGGKSLNVNGAHSYARHANIITRDNGASALDVYDLTLAIQELVKKKTGIELIREVRLLGTFNGIGDPVDFW
ncbi:MAG: UDP-N-acetylmuramate dehydrogenase [Candidatus Omnitrophica bacterium]|nr:UDP-N-acetylmuramate dehydrogenase [Candidatus Omnitrophota bacterium]